MKKFIAFPILLSLAFCLLTGCSYKTYYQVYQTHPVEEGQYSVSNNAIAFENDGCTVLYNFFGKGGDGSFTFVNNTDSIVYISLSESFFILNNVAKDYYQSREWTNSKSQTNNSVSEKVKNGKSMAKSTSITSQESTTFHERGVVIVPPRSLKNVPEYTINNERIDLCGLKVKPMRGKPSGTSFTASDSPIKFGNYVTYRVGMNGKAQHVDNRFYVSEIINVHRKSMFDKVRAKDACGKVKGDKIKVIKYSTADRFYITYSK